MLWQAYAALVDAYAPPALVVDRERRLLQVIGPAAAFLKKFAGPVQTDVLHVVVDDLVGPLAMALGTMGKDHQDIVKTDVRVRTEAGVQSLTVRVKWCQDDGQEPPVMLVILDAIPPAKPLPGVAEPDQHVDEAFAQHTQEPRNPGTQELLYTNQELDGLTRLASHDFQGPLLQVSAFSDVLRTQLGDNLSEPVARSLHYITEGVRQMHALVQDFLTFSRFGQAVIHHRPIALERCVRAALRALASQVEARQVAVVAEALPEVRGDPAMLTQLYQHLLSNALKYVGASPTVVRLTAERRDSMWVLGVHDNGIGIDRKYAEYVFRPFHRLHTNSEYAGTGIGLAICRTIVTRHSGRIWVESELGKGAALYFTIPNVVP